MHVGFSWFKETFGWFEQKEGKAITAFLFALGTEDNPSSYILVIEDSIIPCGRKSNEAFQNLFASFFIFHLGFPTALNHFFKFFEEIVFCIAKPTPSAIEFVNKLKWVLLYIWCVVAQTILSYLMYRAYTFVEKKHLEMSLISRMEINTVFVWKKTTIINIFLMLILSRNPAKLLCRPIYIPFLNLGSTYLHIPTTTYFTKYMMYLWW